MIPPTSAETADLPLVCFVLKLKTDEDRGALATLRGALTGSPDRQMRAWRMLARFGGIPTDDNRPKAEVVRTVAGLLAMPGLHHAGGGMSFGKACRKLLGDEELQSLNKPGQSGPIARRVQHLLAATRDEICDRVCQLGCRLEDASVSLDFNQLHTDLLYWSDRKKARWAADFWGAAQEEESTAGEAKA